MPVPLLVDSLNPAASISGTCQVCGCHGDSCRDRNGEKCDWADPTHTCCTAEVCRAKFASQPKPAPPSPPPPAKSAAKPKAHRRRNNTAQGAWNRYYNS